jgi:hypothetical protein
MDGRVEEGGLWLWLVDDVQRPGAITPDEIKGSAEAVEGGMLVSRACPTPTQTTSTKMSGVGGGDELVLDPDEGLFNPYGSYIWRKREMNGKRTCLAGRPHSNTTPTSPHEGTD